MVPWMKVHIPLRAVACWSCLLTLHLYSARSALNCIVLVVSSSAYGLFAGFTVMEVGIMGSFNVGSCSLSVAGLINCHISDVSALLFTMASHSSQSLGEARTMVTGRAGWVDDIVGYHLSPRIDHYMLTMSAGVCSSRQRISIRIGTERWYRVGYQM